VALSELADAASLLTTLARWRAPQPGATTMSTPVHGWDLFHAISSAVDKFAHIVHSLGPLGEVLAIGLGIPPGVTTGATALLMKVHAGDPKAKAHLKTVVARGANWKSYMHQLNAKLEAHPDFPTFKAHVATVKVHGLIESVVGDWFRPGEENRAVHFPGVDGPFDPAGWSGDDTTFDPPGSHLTSGRGGHHGHHHRKHKPKALPLSDAQEPDDVHPSANGC
jgi:hypothetical protein